jgi:cell division protein FtsB
MGADSVPEGARPGGRDRSAPNDTAYMAKRGPKRRKRIPRRRFFVRWLVLGVFVFVGFLYYQPLRSYLETRDALAGRTDEVRSLREEKRMLEQRLTQADTEEALTREARRLGYVKPGERLFIVKGIDAWRRARTQRPR